MKTINVKIDSIQVSNFSTREKEIEIELFFDKYKTIKKIEIDDPNQQAHDIVVEIRRKVKEKNETDQNEDDILGGLVNVLIENEETTIKKIAVFLCKLSDKINAVKNTTTSDNYMNMLNEVKSMRLEL
jgi:hypothetical protein